MTLVAREDGSGGGFSRMISGGGVLGGVGRSEKANKQINKSTLDECLRFITSGGSGGGGGARI